MRPLYLIVGFWGDRFRSYFLDYCLRSLLSPRNLGALSAADGHRFLICTTAADWQALQRHPAWSALAAHATAVHIEVGLPDGTSEKAKFDHMTLGHRLLLNAAHRDRALTCQIMPDTIYTDGTFETVLRCAAAGAHAVLTVALRLEQEGLFAGLRERGLLLEPASEESSAAPITINARSVVDLVIKNLYDDSLLHDWDRSDFLRWPAYTFWRMPGDRGMLMHSASHAYILFDMATVKQHDERALDMGCIENHWLSDNFPDSSFIHVVQDSDDALLVTWTPSAPFPLPARMPAIVRRLGLAVPWKIYRIRAMREYNIAVGDFQKADHVRYLVRLHGEDVQGADWRPLEERIEKIMTWTFGDVFEEFSGKSCPAAARIALAMWWPLLRLLVRLGLVPPLLRRKLRDSRAGPFLKKILDRLRGLKALVRRAGSRNLPSTSQ